jgi:polyisoprenoid-binding protein YceI
MALSDGRYRFGPEQGQLLLKTSRSGLGRRAGHDLTIEATQWSADAVVNAAEPERSSVTVTVDAGSLEVREGSGGLKPLTGSDRADIKAAIRGKCLNTGDHPQITFTSTQVAGKPESFTITGNLTIMGRTQPASVRAGADGGGRIRGGTTITQSRWGIKPYSGVGGLLKVADEVRIEFDLAEPARHEAAEPA